VRWRNVPFQGIGNGVNAPWKTLIAVEAYHINGIEKVEFACDGGDYVVALEPIQAKYLPNDPVFPTTRFCSVRWQLLEGGGLCG